MPAEKQTYDVCIIGAGPAGLSVLSALQNPTGILTEGQWKQFRRAKRFSGAAAAQRRLSVCVIDPAGWLSEWRGRFKSLGINRLRSPAWATPDYISTGALVEFAVKHGREDELHEIDMPRKMETLRLLAGEAKYVKRGRRWWCCYY